MARPGAEVEALTEFGRSFGMVFQLRDDVLDVVATDDELGKPPGQDLAEGVYTLPVLLALADPAIGPELATLLGQPLAQPERDKARAMVAGSSGHRRHGRGRAAATRPTAAATAGSARARSRAGSPTRSAALSDSLLRPDLPGCAAPGRSGRSVGKAITSRMLATSVRSMASRSMPKRQAPAVGGSPYSMARR